MAQVYNITTQKLFAGTTWSWTENPEEYPVTEYALSVLMKKGTNAAIVMSGVVEGSAFRFSKLATETSLLPQGDYAFQIIATKTGVVALVDSGTVTVYPLLNAINADPRTYWQTIADLLRTAYQNMAGREFTEITINGKTVRYDRAQLLKELNNAEYKASVESNQRPNKKILVYF